MENREKTTLAQDIACASMGFKVQAIYVNLTETKHIINFKTL